MDLKFPEELNQRIQESTALFWSTRSRQKELGAQDQGNRGAVTGGAQLDGFVRLIRDILLLNGVPETCVYTNSGLELPGYYRPNKKWDLLVVDDKNLVIAIEFKSQVGPSFGNNFNNRTEEAMGSALDLWTAYREDVFGTHQPWLGYFMVLEDCEKSNKPVKTSSPHFDILDEFQNASYMKRYEIFCKKLLLERAYQAACLLTTKRTDGGCEYHFPKKKLSFKKFAASMLGASVSYFSG